MTNLERFNQHEMKAFEQSFPMDEVREIESEGDRKLDPFKTLARFGFLVKDEQQAKDIILAEISASRFGPQINLIDSEQGVRIYGQDIIPFLRAATDIYLNTLNLWTDEARQKFGHILSK
jgi:hypothetical protein